MTKDNKKLYFVTVLALIIIVALFTLSQFSDKTERIRETLEEAEESVLAYLDVEEYFDASYPPKIKEAVERVPRFVEITERYSPDTKDEQEPSTTPPATETSEPVDEPTTQRIQIEDPEFKYVYIYDSCDHEYEGQECVKAYPEPRSNLNPVARFREGMVLRVGGQVTYKDTIWYQITFEDQTLHHPERLINDWWVAADDVQILYDEGEKTIYEDGKPISNKRIVVDKSEQKLYAYDGEILFMEETVSTGIELTDTPLGTHEIFKKRPSRYMQGPTALTPGDFFDLPGVPWNLYFTQDGAVIHGTYWHENFGTPYSHGCVNMTVESARKLYNWATLGTKVIVQD